MQDVTPQLLAGTQRIDSYGPAGFRIAGVDHAGSVLVTPEATLPWSATSLTEVTPESLAPLLVTRPEILLIGTGARNEMLSPALRAALKAQGVGVDGMDTGAAARTFNVLLSESRRVAAALLLPH